MQRPLVATIKRNSLDDGPGIRSTVFFKGCPLSCVWCHNPECLRARPELVFQAERCIACGACIQSCPHGAFGERSPGATDRDRCQLCGTCLDECPSGAREIVGQSYGARELVELLQQDRSFFRNSGGGVTFSGGEPTLYPEYLAEVARMLREGGTQVLLETCGDFPWEPFDRLLRPLLDRIWIDLKIVDDEQHRCRLIGRT